MLSVGCIYVLHSWIHWDLGILTKDWYNDCDNQLCHQANIYSNVSLMQFPLGLRFGRTHRVLIMYLNPQVPKEVSSRHDYKEETASRKIEQPFKSVPGEWIPTCSHSRDTQQEMKPPPLPPQVQRIMIKSCWCCPTSKVSVRRSAWSVALWTLRPPSGPLQH